MPKVNNELVSECFAETEMIKILLDLKKVNHKHGKSNVANTLRTNLRNNKAIGIVDEDRNKGNQPKYFSEFTRILISHDCLLIKQHHTLEHYLIIIQPEIEYWLLNAARESNIDPLDFNLPYDLRIRDITKSNTLHTNNDFRNFIKKLISEKSSSLLTLKNFIQQVYPN